MSSWSRKAGAPGMREHRSGPAKPISIRARSASKSSILAMPYGYPDFPSAQIAAVTAFCRSIFTRHTIPPTRVLAHSDVAPSRKQDPGEKFPWQRLARFRRRPLGQSGADHRGRRFSLGDRGDAVIVVAAIAGEFGYGIPTTACSIPRRTMSLYSLPAAFPARACRRCADLSTLNTLAGARAPNRAARTMAARVRACDASLPPLPLDGGGGRPHPCCRQSAGRPLRRSPKGGRGGKSGLHGQTVPDNVRRVRAQGQCHREQTAAARCVLSRGKGETVR